MFDVSSAGRVTPDPAGTTGRARSTIAVLGSANMDLVVGLARPPRPGETVFGDTFTTVPGGKGLNQAVAAARAGGRVHFVGSVGEDAFGVDLLNLLRAEGISVDEVSLAAEPTGTAHITVDHAGQNSIIVVSGANRTVTGAQLTDDVLSQCGWLVTQLELPLGTVRAALLKARKLGLRTVLTPAPVQELDAGLLRTVDLLVPNELEATSLAGGSDPWEAAAVLSRVCRDVVVTLGGSGAIWATGGDVVAEVAAHRVDAVDTTGAGDTFVGYLVALLAEGASRTDALEVATAAAGLAVTRAGATSSMPTRTDVQLLLGLAPVTP